MTAHFSEDALKFLRGLARNNDRPWFDERKPVYERELKQPMLAVIAEINQALQAMAPAYARPPQKTMMRIYRDTRFSTNKFPYNTHLSAWWAPAGLRGIGGGGFYLQVSPKGVIVAGGCYRPERLALLAIRQYLLEHHQELRALLADKRLCKLTKPFDGLKLTRAPRGFPADHPAIDLISCKQ
jgi:uncharacterized protein (TIGR02453 family)